MIYKLKRWLVQGDFELKLITWNVAGRVKMLPRQIEYLAAHQPDIVTLQEVTKTTAPLFKGLLPSLGLKHIVCSIDFVIDSSSLKGPRRYELRKKVSAGY
jgi:hypothetical protein